MYCPRSKVFGDNKCQLKDDPTDDKCIPEDYKNTYASFNLAYISFMANHVVKLVTQKRLGCPLKLQDVHKSAYMSAHLVKNKIFTWLEDGRYISSKVIEKGSQDDKGFERLEENMLKQQPEDTLPCLNITTKMNHMVSSAIGDGIACMEGSHAKRHTNRKDTPR